MAFSAFTLQKGVCSSTTSHIFLPTCPLLTFDLALLHLLSSATLALLLVILSLALSPSYLSSYSLTSPDNPDGDEQSTKADDGFVMWELALASPPKSHANLPEALPPFISYGTPGPTTPLAYAQPNPYNSLLPASPSTAEFDAPRKTDKFAEGRVWSYGPLAVCSVCVAVTAGVVIGEGEYVGNSIFIIVVSCLSLLFSVVFLARQYSTRAVRSSDPEDKSLLQRYDRAVEVACAGSLFLLWPLAAIIYTLFPSTPNRPCFNPQTPSAPYPPLDNEYLPSICLLSSTVIALSWLASWIMFARILGLVFPLPQMKIPVAVHTEEERGLLAPPPIVRPQVKYGRIVAGEAFELGEDDD
ncbi:hypothetical protein P7C73_g3613, partial [Tremellales sp. Uapishka_1]